MRKQRICIQTLGCPKNIVDSEKIISALDKNQYDLTNDVKAADIILVNTCGFIASAYEENKEQIGLLEAHKKKFPSVRLIVFGCLVTRLHNNGMDLNDMFPLVDVFFPVNSLDMIINDLNGFKVSNFNREKSKYTPYSAYLKISDGCDRQCTFCTIPYIKGKYVSEPLEQLLNEATLLAQNGVKELILIGQETTNYGKDIGTDFYSLLDRLSRIQDIKWIRIMYAHPSSLDMRIFDLMHERKNICQYIDIPLQHISNNILDLMQRGIQKSKIISLIKQIREKVPGICIRTTFIVGFPSESDEDFNELYEFVKKVKFDRMGVFLYSPESETKSYSIEPQVSQRIAIKRHKILMQLQQQISTDKNKKLIDREIEVLIEGDYIGKEGNIVYYGRSYKDAPDIDNTNLIISSKKLDVGEFYNATINNVTAYETLCHI